MSIYTDQKDRDFDRTVSNIGGPSYNNSNDGYHQCKHCGKRFYVQTFQRERWHWREGKAWYCSYTCRHAATNHKQKNSAGVV